MKRLKGTVKNNVIVLAEGVHLPEGLEVEVRLPSERKKRREQAFQRILNNPITHFVGIDEIIEEDKKEREERWELGGPAER